MAKTLGFKAIDLSNAVLFGWAQHHKLSANDLQVLMWVAVRGMRSEPGVAFAWFPVGGQQDWSVTMCMEYSTLRSTLLRLRKKSLLEQLPGSSSDNRFRRVKGFGIPLTTLIECRQWYQDRVNLEASLTSFLGKVRPQVNGFGSAKLSDSDATTCPHNNTVCPHNNTVCPHNNTVCPHNNTGTAVTRSFTTHTKEDTKEEPEYPSGTRCAEGAEPLVDRAPIMRSEDSWSVPRDSRDDFDAPRDSRKKGSGSASPSSKVLDLFFELWTQSRQERKSLAYPWSMKVVFQTRVKQLIAEQGLDKTLVMVRVFFRLVDSGQVSLKSDDLWKDFWFNRAKLEGIARKSIDSYADQPLDQQAELEKFRQMVRDRRRD